MRRALFDPEQGYYSRHIATVGSHGDFSTAATLSPMLGAGVARWLEAQRGDQPGVKAVIEVGGGDGSLMKSVRKALGWCAHRRLSWHMVETSPVLRTQQRAALGGRSVVWHRDLADALSATDGAAFIYHNELLDAFPCERIEWDPESARWKEVWVASEGPTGTVEEELRARDWTSEERQAFDVLREWSGSPLAPATRQRVELHATVRDWLSEWSSGWQSGAMLTIDYGDLFPKVYYRRSQGTVRGYFLQQRTEGLDVYANPGRQDLTADINFSDYRSWAKDLGWHEMHYGSLRSFLDRHTPDLVRKATGINAQLLEEGSAADAFQCVEHRPA